MATSRKFFLLLSVQFFAFLAVCFAQAPSYALQNIKEYPFPTEMTASAQKDRIAWAFDERGQRNVYVAEGPKYEPRQLTAYKEDDGQEITSLSVSPDGRWVTYVRGGDHGSNWNDEQPVNVSHSPVPQKVQLWTLPFDGGQPRAIAEGDDPVVSPRSDSVSFIKNGQAWIAPIDGSSPAKTLFATQGTTGSLQYSPDGSQIAFVSSRGDHSFIGVFSFAGTALQWIAPSFKHDNNPRWSPDGKKLVFIRNAGGGGAPDSVLVRRHQPWSVYTADVVSGIATEVYRSPATLQGSVPSTQGGYNLHWAANDRLVFVSYIDGWPHLYSLPTTGGQPLLLTPGNFMVEHVQLSQDKNWLYFSANTGPDELDVDRRHAVRVPVDRAAMEVLTPGTGLEWTPVPMANGNTVALISATAQRPPLPAVLSLENKKLRLLADEKLATFPLAAMIVPKPVLFKSADGVTVHAQLFQPAGGTDRKKPAIVYVHGGPSRQMLLGWHYSDYYANAYAYNQYLASQGFVVLSVNYRLGIGYGYKFQQPEGGGRTGASEYQDVRAAALWLGEQTFVDKSRIGIYGGSYGGFLTAMALAKDSKLFAAGVDIHGVHDWTTSRGTTAFNGGFEKVPDIDSATHLAYRSSPVAYVQNWTSPVLIIHGDDDRNVPFSQSADLVKRLERKGVPMETMVIVGDTHHWMKHENAVTVGKAIADFFVRRLMKKT